MRPAHSRALHPTAHSCPCPKPHCWLTSRSPRWLTSMSRSHPCPASRLCLPPPPTPHGLPASTSLILLPARAHIPPTSRGCTPPLLGTGSPRFTPVALSLCRAPPLSPAPQPTLEWHRQDPQNRPCMSPGTTDMSPRQGTACSTRSGGTPPPKPTPAQARVPRSTRHQEMRHLGTLQTSIAQHGARTQGPRATPKPCHLSPASPPGRSRHVPV